MVTAFEHMLVPEVGNFFSFYLTSMEKHVSACMSICPAVSPTVTMDVTSFTFYMMIAYIDIW